MGFGEFFYGFGVGLASELVLDDGVADADGGDACPDSCCPGNEEAGVEVEGALVAREFLHFLAAGEAGVEGVVVAGLGE